MLDNDSKQKIKMVCENMLCNDFSKPTVLLLLFELLAMLQYLP